ncbi:Alpha-(1,3)-fucosyltransferase 9 [Larimichthys crocea]|uniref:Uncharacterized protein n=2 Tax=Larimichthys crocea TaxID=215358 RepID=A0ACD3Q703_LARCR|nr:alpha-(1,3)-fucosyltransferase 9-like [Larimichthys crocea]KAE8281358.1 Alpha-(1,3)-fucosyltransferase 9 [Larimichthys crocea]TMS02922.1 Alpha-(1,3)-fucosyltransferase 9 [Larimichthys crocea]
MPCQPSNWSHQRTVIFVGLVFLCFPVILYIYYKPDIKFPDFNISSMIGHQPCPKCVHSQELHPNCSNKEHPDDTQKIQVAAVNNEPDTILLIWFWPFGYKFDISCSDYNITRCRLTDDRSLYNKAHGVLFHHRDMRGISNLPKKPRPRFQKWVWWNMESPANCGQITELNQLINLTCSYRLDSHIPVQYGSLVPVTPKEETFKLPAKDRLVCWIVSNWGAHQRRVQVYNELKKHVKVECFGGGCNQRISNDEYTKIMKGCKFYLSFENSVYKDYVTEKLYSPLIQGAVPVVLGPPRENYERLVPGDSFIHVDDFPTAKELAERLLYLDKHDDEYMKYHNWRKWYEVKMGSFGKEHACKSCRYIQNHREYQRFNDLTKWFWG